MNKIILFFIISACLFSGTVSESYKIKGMFCQYGCANKVKSLMTDLDGMKKCEVDFDKSLMTVEYDDKKVNESLILSTLEKETTFETKKVKNKQEEKSFWNRLKGFLG